MEPPNSFDSNDPGTDPGESWARIASELRAYRDAQRRAWGDLDDATIARFLAGEAPEEESERVRATMRTHPKVQECVDILRDVLGDSVELAPLEKPPVIPFRPRPLRWIAAAALAASALILGIVLIWPSSRNKELAQKAVQTKGDMLLAVNALTPIEKLPPSEKNRLSQIKIEPRPTPSQPPRKSMFARSSSDPRPTLASSREALPPPVSTLMVERPLVEAPHYPASRDSLETEGIAPVSLSGDNKAATPPKLDPFWDESDQKKVWDFDKFTSDEERELGRALHRMVLHDHAEIDSGGPLQKRLEDAAKPYLAAVTRKDVEYTFTVLDCPRLNVFSHPGGYIYVCKGLFDRITEDEDYALEFILAHEIAHVDLGHAVVCMRDPDIKKNFKFGTSLFFYTALIPGGYLKPQDLEADQWAVEQMLKAGRTRYQVLAFLRRLEDYAKSNGFENKRKAPNDEPRIPILDNHIRVHPIPRTRLEEAKAFIDRLQKK